MPSLRGAISAALLLLPTCIFAVTLDCANIRDDGHTFNLKKLGGPKTVHRVRWANPSIENTTFTIDICNPLKKPKGSSKESECPLGTRVCGKEWDRPSGGTVEYLKKVIPIAGDYTATNGRGIDAKYTRLKGSSSNSDGKEGVLVELHGGKYPNERAGTPQKAILEFLCDKTVTGNEGFEDEQVDMDPLQYTSMHRRDDKDDSPELPDLDEGKNIKFVSYHKEGDTEVLRVRWKTKYACENAEDAGDPEDSNKGGWGFFTWFIIILFLLVAAYIIFGSWLNYNRYGARGWDLIPHGDTIRDIPYLIKDWGSNVFDRLKGGDSRGGYSAV